MAVALTAAMPAFAYDEALGKEVFEGNCATCHSGGKNVLIPSKTLAKADIEKYLDGGFNLSAILYQVRFATKDGAVRQCTAIHEAN